MSPWAIDWSSRDVLTGHVFLLAASLSWSAAIIVTRAAPPRSTMFELMPWCFAVSAVMLAPLVYWHAPNGSIGVNGEMAPSTFDYVCQVWVNGVLVMQGFAAADRNFAKGALQVSWSAGAAPLNRVLLKTLGESFPHVLMAAGTWDYMIASSLPLDGAARHPVALLASV